MQPRLVSEHSGLLTDLYELTMAAGYLQTRFDARATFELFVRHLPPHRNYLVAAGLEPALEFLEKVRFTSDEISFLQAHSWVMAHEDGKEAFAHFLDAFPEHAVLLLDTYDVRAAVRKIIEMGRKPSGVRIDSGDLAEDSKWIRKTLDRAGWKDVSVFAS